MNKLLLGLATLLISVGCSASHTLKRADTIPSAPNLDPNRSMFVNLPADGTYSDKSYAGSGQSTATTIVTAFSRHLEHVDASATTMSQDEGLQHAVAQGFTYFANPSILHWEDRATEWSGKPDRITFRVDLLEAATQTLLDSVTIQGTSKWATFGGDHPEDLLAKPLFDYAASLFQSNTE